MLKQYASSTFTLLLAAVVTVGLSACAEGQTGETGPDTTGGMAADTTGGMGTDTTGGMAADTTGGISSDSVSVQGTTQLLQGGVTSIAAQKAVQNLDGWQQKLQGTEWADLRDQLGNLKEELTADEIDGNAVGDMLIDLGNKTSEAASGASGQTATRLNELAMALTQAGEQLGGEGAY